MIYAENCKCKQNYSLYICNHSIAIPQKLEVLLCTLRAGATSCRYLYYNTGYYLFFFSTIHLLCTKPSIVLFSSFVFAGSRVKVIAGTAANKYFLVSEIKKLCITQKFLFCSTMTLNVILSPLQKQRGAFLS